MSCIKCEEIQDGTMTAYYRWRNANVEINGCPEHLREIFAALNDVQEKMKEARG